MKFAIYSFLSTPLFLTLKCDLDQRVPHALVMTVLFRSDLTSMEKLRNIFKLAAEHATNLAAFAAIYKSLLLLLKWSSRSLLLEQNEKNIGKVLLKLIIDGPRIGQESMAGMIGHPQRNFHALLSGAVGGYFVWGSYSSVNHQIILYLLSRVLVALSKRALECFSPHTRGQILKNPRAYRLFSSAVWGLVMILFEDTPHILHPSLKKSMDEIYRFKFSPLDLNREI